MRSVQLPNASPSYVANEEDKFRRQVELALLQVSAPQATDITGILNAPTVFNVNAYPYNAKGDNATDATDASRVAFGDAALAGGGNMAEVFYGPGTYLLSGNPFGALVGTGNVPLRIRLSQAVWKTTKQIKLPKSAVITGINRLRCGILADSSFISSVTINTIDLVSNVVTVKTNSAHGLETGATIGIQGVVTQTAFNGGWFPVTVTDSTHFTFPFTHANISDTTGTVYIQTVVLGDTAPLSSGVRIEDCFIDCNNVTDSVALYSNCMAEMSGCFRVDIINAYKYGIWIEKHGTTALSGGPNNYAFYDMEVSVTPNVAGVCVYIRGKSALHRGFDHITTNTSTNTGTSAAGFDVSGAPGLYSRIHCEHATDGFLIGNRGLTSDLSSGRDSAGIVLSGVTGEQSITNLVHIKNYGENHDIVVQGVSAYGSVNSLVDDVASITLTAGFAGDEYLGWYMIGGIPTNTRISSSPNVPWLIGPLLTGSAGLTAGGSALAADRSIIVNAAAGQNRNLVYQAGGVNIWIVRADSVAHSGGNAGSDYQIVARDDSGALIDVPFQIVRAAGGLLTLNRPTSVANGDLKVVTVGNGLYVKEGTNATAGVSSAMIGGTTTISTTKVTAVSRIQLTIQSPGGTVGGVYVSARTPGTSFVITSTAGADTSTVAWLIVEPA